MAYTFSADGNLIAKMKGHQPVASAKENIALRVEKYKIKKSAFRSRLIRKCWF